MIAVDTNILVAFVRSEYTWHEKARERVGELAEGPAAWALPWPCIHEFLAVTTNPRIFRTPLSNARAIDAVDAFLESPTARLIGEGPGYWESLRPLLAGGDIVGARVHDARIAAICLSHGVTELWTADRDFGRFPALRVRNPCV
ncbi:MAG: PIN domain-containing protein [Planctomycetia bacterium]|nr:PIN domain-containing protein [Planctomycetia bacterium]